MKLDKGKRRGEKQKDLHKQKYKVVEQGHSCMWKCNLHRSQEEARGLLMGSLICHTREPGLYMQEIPGDYRD